MAQSTEPVIPGERGFAGRDPWFDRLITLSEVEGEFRELLSSHLFLDPGSRPLQADLAGMTVISTVGAADS